MIVIIIASTSHIASAKVENLFSGEAAKCAQRSASQLRGGPGSTGTIPPTMPNMANMMAVIISSIAIIIIIFLAKLTIFLQA